jgi:hypothetical protein
MGKPVMAIVAAVAAVATVAGCAGSSAPAMVQVRGSFDWTITSRCSQSSLPDSQVRITDSSGTVLATADLPDMPVNASVDGVSVYKYAYSATVPAEARYGVAIGTTAPYYVTRAQFVKGVDLSC